MDHTMLIEKYLQGSLSDEERSEFDTLRATDEEFAREVAFQENLREVVHADQDPLRKMVGELESEFQENSPTSGMWKKLLVAASIFAVLGLAVYFNMNKPVSSSDLYESYFESYPNVVNPLVRGNTTDPKNTAFEAYENGRYQEAYDMFSDLLETEDQLYYQFYMANALLELGQAKEAIVLLNEFSSSQDKLADRASWYLAMAYLQLDDKERAIIELEKIVDLGAYNASEA
ncbi:MAG: tetratricopeptide repeat protein, partial [Flavobacteriaceae bacterium]